MSAPKDPLELTLLELLLGIKTKTWHIWSLFLFLGLSMTYDEIGESIEAVAASIIRGRNATPLGWVAD